MPDAYIILMTPTQKNEVRAALTARRTLLQGSNRTAVIHRNVCLKEDKNDEARAIEDLMAENDSSMEVIDGLLSSIEGAG